MALAETESTVSKPWQFKPGVSANPAGRPPGSKNKLGEAFVAALHQDFQIHGPKVIETVRIDKPDVYLKVIAQIIPKELTIKQDTFGDITDEQLAAILAAARSALGIIEGSTSDTVPETGGKQAQVLQALPKAE